MTTRTPVRGISPKIWGIALIVLLFLVGGALLADLPADPPLGPTDLEGQLLLAARAATPGQRVPLGDWNPAILIPVQTQVDRLAFSIGGVGFGPARAAGALTALLVLALFFLLIRRSGHPFTAFLATAFLAVNPIFFGVARTALPLTTGLLLMLVAIWLWLFGSRQGWAAFLSGAVVVTAGLVENGPADAFFLLAGGMMAIFVRMHGWKMTWAGAVHRRVQAFLAGAAVALAVFVFVILHHWTEVGAVWGHFVRGSFRSLPVSVILSPVHFAHMVRLMPVVALVALAYFLFFAKSVVGPVIRHRRLDEGRLWFLVWLLGGVPFMVFGTGPSLYDLALLVPPICALAAEGTVRLFALRRIERPRLDVMIVMAMIAGVTWFVVFWAVHLLFARNDLPLFLMAHRIRWAFVFATVLWSALTGFLGWFYLTWKRFTLTLRPLPVAALSVLLALVILGSGAAKNLEWWRSRGHSERDLARRIEGLGGHALVVGSWAPTATLGTPVGAAIIWSGMNEDRQSWRQEVTHLLLSFGRESDPYGSPARLFDVQGGGPGIAPVDTPMQVGGARLQLYRILRSE